MSNIPENVKIPEIPLDLIFPIPFPEYQPKLNPGAADAITNARATLADLFQLCKYCTSEERETCDTIEIVERMAAAEAFTSLPFNAYTQAIIELQAIEDNVRRGYEAGRAPNSPRNIGTVNAFQLAAPEDRYDVAVHDYLALSLEAAEKVCPGEKRPLNPLEMRQLTRNLPECLPGDGDIYAA